MKYTATCPACAQEINMINIMSAVTPFSFKCGKCRARIFIKKITWQILALMVAFGIMAVISFRHLLNKPQLPSFMHLLVPIGILILLEIVTALLVCNKAELVARGQ